MKASKQRRIALKLQERLDLIATEVRDLQSNRDRKKSITSNVVRLMELSRP